MFFKCTLEFFEARLLHCYTQVDEPGGVQFEHVYFDQLIDVRDEFATAPELVGQQASTGTIY